jgi:1-deoxy-D-xylulose-5-phosphate synthase
MDRAGLSGDDGPTHHGLFDIGYLRGVPNIVVMAPKDEDELADMMCTALDREGPSAIRYPRGAGPGVRVKRRPSTLEIGKAEQLRHGNEVAVWGLGAAVPLAEAFADRLEQEGFSAAVVNARFVKPLDTELLEEQARNVSLIVTFEDHVLMGGFGSAVLEHLSACDLKVPVVRIGWPDNFVEHGKVDRLRERYGLSVEAALEQAQPFLDAIRRKEYVETW